MRSSLKIKLLWKHEVHEGLWYGCQCAKGTQDTESSISNETLKPDGALITCANKETKRKLHNVILMNDFSEALT